MPVKANYVSNCVVYAMRLLWSKDVKLVSHAPTLIIEDEVLYEAHIHVVLRFSLYIVRINHCTKQVFATTPVVLSSSKHGK